jgi:hypothetical protein
VEISFSVLLLMASSVPLLVKLPAVSMVSVPPLASMVPTLAMLAAWSMKLVPLVASITSLADVVDTAPPLMVAF